MSTTNRRLRRDLLKTLVAGTMAASLGGCAPIATTPPVPATLFEETVGSATDLDG